MHFFTEKKLALIVYHGNLMCVSENVIICYSKIILGFLLK